MIKKLIALTLALLLFIPALYAETGSWSQINQTIVRPEGWRKIVTHTDFPLGKKEKSAQYPGIYVQHFGSYPSLDGSTVSVPLGMELARQHLDLEESDLNGFVTFSTTHSAYERLIHQKPNPDSAILSLNAAMEQDKSVNLILATEPSREEEAMAKQAGVELVKVPFCYDAFVFLVNAENPVDSLTADQIRGIYTGRFRAWNEVGSTESAAIEAYQRPPNSGSQTAMENMVMKGLRLAAAKENYISDGMADIVQQVGNYDNGRYTLGYSYLFYVNRLFQQTGLKVLKVDGITPTQETMRAKLYPFTVRYYAVYRKGDSEAERFARWLTGEEGQLCVKQAGYIPL